MKRRSFLLGAAAVAAFGHEPPPVEPPPEQSPDGPSLLHECVDRPELPCPACAAWTGDPLAIQDNLTAVSRLRKFNKRRAS